MELHSPTRQNTILGIWFLTIRFRGCGFSMARTGWKALASGRFLLFACCSVRAAAYLPRRCMPTREIAKGLRPPLRTHSLPTEHAPTPSVRQPAALPRTSPMRISLRVDAFPCSRPPAYVLVRRSPSAGIGRQAPPRLKQRHPLRCTAPQGCFCGAHRPRNPRRRGSRAACEHYYMLAL